MELHIDGQNVDIHEALRTLIVGRLEKLNARHGDIIHARVSLIKSGHHQHGSDETRIVLSMTRRKVLQATRVGKTLEDAINSAFEALQRELSVYRQKRRERDRRLLKIAKERPRLTGKVIQVLREQGYGFVDIGADEAVYFSRQAVVGSPFEQMSEGMAVEVELVESPQGYEAVKIVPLHV